MIESFVKWASLPSRSAEHLRGWSTHGVWRNGELAGIAIVNGTEIHFASAPEQRGVLFQRARARNFLKPLLSRRGYLTTTVRQGDRVSKRFIERLGFAPTWGDGLFDHYMLCELPFSKEN